MQFNNRELGTVLAALRMWQAQVTDSKAFPVIPERYAAIATDGGPPLNAEEIDDLCERINTDEGPLVIVSGGMVQNYEQDCGFDLLDYDNLKNEGEYPPEEWANLSEQAKRYVRQHDAEIADRFEPERKDDGK